MDFGWNREVALRKGVGDGGEVALDLRSRGLVRRFDGLNPNHSSGFLQQEVMASSMLVKTHGLLATVIEIRHRLLVQGAGLGRQDCWQKHYYQ